MSILALAVYGSRAREDHTNSSDIDLFAITDEPTYRVVVNSSINTVFYPEALALERAHNGDLFLLHIIKEAKVIYDLGLRLDSLQENFHYKESYDREILNASALGWMLIDLESNISNYTLLNRRITWCVRTILIAKSAERKKPIFSSKALQESTDAPYVTELIKNKDNDLRNVQIIDYFKSFLSFQKLERPLPGKENDMTDYIKLFFRTRNEVALKTITSLRSQYSADSYI